VTMNHRGNRDRASDEDCADGNQQRAQTHNRVDQSHSPPPSGAKAPSLFGP
jgi:hypothetical protein